LSIVLLVKYQILNVVEIFRKDIILFSYFLLRKSLKCKLDLKNKKMKDGKMKDKRRKPNFHLIFPNKTTSVAIRIYTNKKPHYLILAK